MTQTPTPPGWYPDPQNPGQQRYWDGARWTEHQAPASAQTAPAAPAGPYGGATAKAAKPWYLRWYSIAGAIFLLLVIIAAVSNSGSDTTTNTNSSSGDDSTAASSSVSSSATHSTKPKKKAPKKAGLSADSDVENVVLPGKGYQLGDFKILPGWKVKNAGYGLGYTVKNLRVQNTTNSSHTFSVDIKLYKGKNTVTADISCIANEAKPGNLVEVDCLPDGSGKPYNRVTINNSF